MTVEDKHGIVLEFTEPATKYDSIYVNHCREGKAPERIGRIQRVFDEKTGICDYQAYNEYFEPMGKSTTDWQEVELSFLRHAYERGQHQVVQTFLRIARRNAELRTLREGKNRIVGRELTK